MTTIIFNNVKLSTYNYEYGKLEECLKNKKFFDVNNDYILFTSESSNNNNNINKFQKLIHPPFGNGLLGTMYMAYACHVPLVLRPDDIWLAIVTSFGNYVKTHSEEMRNLFVDHIGRKQLIVKVDTLPLHYTDSEQWTNFIGFMTDEIKKNVKGDIADWIVPNFSTTTSTDITISQIALMGSVSEFFDMKFELSCGLSKLTLEGTLDDWKKMYKQCQKMYEFGIKNLSNWADLLLPVIDEFINTYQNNIDQDFWQRMCTYKTRGSGKQKTFRGWFLVFSPFNESGKYLLKSLESVKKNHIYGIVDDDDIVDCGINVQIPVNDHGNMCQAVFYAGLLMTKYNDTNNALAPKPAWLMIQKKHIQLDDMINSLRNQMIKYSSSFRKEDRKSLEDLVKFAHYIATKCYFPNDKLIFLVDQCTFYHMNRRFDSMNLKNANKFVSWLASNVHFDCQPNILAKYIDPVIIDKLASEYLATN